MAANRLFRLGLIIFLLCGIAVRGQGQESPDQPRASDATAPAVSVMGLDSDGLGLISPASPNFDSTVRGLLSPKTATLVLGLKPYLAILANRSGQTIVAYAIIWKTISHDHRTKTETGPVLFPDAVTPLGNNSAIAFVDRGHRAITVGEQRLVSNQTAFGPGSDEKQISSGDRINLLNWIRAVVQGQKTELAEAGEVQIHLDAAIFSDGLLVGPDSSDLGSRFTIYLEAKQRLFRQIVSDLDAGRSMDEAFAPAKTLAAKFPGPDASDHHGRAVYELLAAQEIMALRKHIGDSAVPFTFRQGVRKDPFVIRRNSSP